MHSVGYKRKYRDVIIPRSAKAYRIHFILAFLKPILFAALIVFVPTPSFTWRIILAIVGVLIVSNLILLISRTRSKTSFLLNWFLLIKVFIWMTLIITQTTAYPGLVFYTDMYLGIYIVLFLIFLDMFLDLILRAFPFYHKLYQPLTSQTEIVEVLFKKGYQNYLDVPVWSTVYPFFRWLF